ncbi:nucleoside triphosphate pyrophosphohydrolase [Conservatibacter flavescens]|uniref:Nucleoside triphosphate pyrophosphohydrolase n=1 Tax=Conservatibacter flavescens TaxID=28161 RepID=A0A2M8S4K8_9PAST|nr:nucleoside triphosphate pyrophosphohydrolase [Conservatibacter flavescens]PJG86085.1 nucleoside triphosphate pyrophosphohydrolase [Conservatibacter flavescens]
MQSYTIHDFTQLIAKLRDPQEGCPWDLKQNYQTMIPCLLEESYEVVEAIRQGNPQDLKEELGDLLLQVVFLSQLACEEQKFDFNDVIQTICEKIIRRHPHVFGNQSAHNEEEALQNWNAIKAEENKNKGHQSILDNIPHAFPALIRAEKLQKRCSKLGFDWQTIPPVIEKVHEELHEVSQELHHMPQNHDKIEEEIGDLLFAVVNLSRHVKCQPEEALHKANHKFEQRFRFIEQELAKQGKSLEDSTLSEMDWLWDLAKTHFATNK